MRANLEIAQPILRLRNTFAQSRNCAIRLSNTFAQSRDCANAICERNGLMGWEHPRWLTEESWELSEMVMPWTGALHRSGISLLPYPDQGEGSFSELVSFPEAPSAGDSVLWIALGLQIRVPRSTKPQAMNNSNDCAIQSLTRACENRDRERLEKEQ